MKPTKFAAVAVAVALTCSAKATVLLSLPLVKLTISGTVSYNAAAPATNGTTVKSSLTTVSLTAKYLIGLLNASPAVTNTLLDVKGTNQIPAGSYFVYELNNSLYDPLQISDVTPLIVTNINGFNFTLAGYDSVAATNFDYGYLNIDEYHLIGSYSQNDITGAGSESDLTGIEFFFNDGNGNSLDDYGNGSLKWSFGSVSNSFQRTTLTISFPAPNGCNDTVNYHPAIAQNVKCSGSASGYVASDIFPFYISWNE